MGRLRLVAQWVTLQCFRRGSMNELIENEKTGFLVNTIEEAVEKVEMINQIQRSYCRQWAQFHFSKEKMVSDYMAVYEKILSK